jgi:hypothetical protein
MLIHAHAAHLTPLACHTHGPCQAPHGRRVHHAHDTLRLTQVYNRHYHHYEQLTAEIPPLLCAAQTPPGAPFDLANRLLTRIGQQQKSDCYPL